MATPKEKATARAQELKIQVPEGATLNQINDLIKIAEHKILTVYLSEAEKTISNQSSALETAATRLEDQKKLTDKANEDLNLANQRIGESEKANEKLTEELEALKAEPTKEKFASYENEEGVFEFSVKNFRFKGEKYTAVKAVEDPELMEALIEAGYINLVKK